MNRIIITLFCLFGLLSFKAELDAQSYNGTVANDWTLTDINGQSHNLYTLLDEGKSVYIDFSATWCGICWNFHSSHVLEDIYQQYGPDGTDEVAVFFIEVDGYTITDCLYGSADCNGSSAGNWTAGVSYPIINATQMQADSFISEYNITGYPEVSIICPSYKKWKVPSSTSFDFLTKYIQSCELSIDSVHVVDAECDGTTMGSIDIDVSGGYGDLTYDWNNGEMTQDIDSLAPGFYNVTVTDLNGIFTVESMEVMGESGSLDIELIAMQNPSCSSSFDGSLEVIAIGGTPSYTLTWNHGEAGTSLDSLAAGIYTVTVVDDMGCSFSESYTLSAPEEPQVTTIIEPAACGQSSGSIAIIAENIGSATFDIGNGPQDDYEFENLAGGNYTLEIIYANECSYTEEFTIPSTDGPMVEILTTDTLLECALNEMQIQAQVMGSLNNLEFDWSTNDGNILGPTTGLFINIDAYGTYIFSATDVLGNCSSMDTIEITGPERPSVDAGIDTTLTCDVNSLRLHGTYIYNGNVSYSWTTEDGNIQLGGTGLTPLINAAGTYTFTVVTDDGCTVADDVVIDLYDNTPMANFGFTQSLYTVSLSSSAIGDNLSYEWSFGDGGSSTEINPSYTYNEEGNYPICLQVSNECGSNTLCDTVEINGLSIDIVSEINDVSCYGESDGSISLINNSDFAVTSYTWSNGDTGATIDGLSAGTYTVTITLDNGFTSEISYTVNQPEELIANISSIDDANGSVDIEVSGGTPPYNYIWNNGSMDQDQSGLSEGTYAVLIKDANKCSAYVEVIIMSTSVLEPHDYFKIYPNPVQDYIHIDLKNAQSSTFFELLQMDGSTLKVEYLHELKNSINIKDIASGMYILRVSADDKIYYHKILKI